MSTEKDVDDREAGGAGLHRANEQQARLKRMERVRSGDSSLDGVVVHKVCCVCGSILNHKMRFKDHEGRYWCPSCNEADQSKVKPLPCADCGIEMSRMDLKEVSGLLLCPVCVSKVASQGAAVAQVRLSALQHGQEHGAAAALTARKVAASRSDHVVVLLWVGLGAVVAALAVMLVVAMM